MPTPATRPAPPSFTPVRLRSPERRRPATPRPVITHEVLDVVLTVGHHRIKGRFTPANLELRVLTRPWGGTVFPTPAAAAQAVADYFAVPGRPRRTPAWLRAGSGQVLRAPVGAH